MLKIWKYPCISRNILAYLEISWDISLKRAKYSLVSYYPFTKSTKFLFKIRFFISHYLFVKQLGIVWMLLIYISIPVRVHCLVTAWHLLSPMYSIYQRFHEAIYNADGVQVTTRRCSRGKGVQHPLRHSSITHYRVLRTGDCPSSPQSSC